jgi:tRNA G18 (ribose-2'-O)-methylase SpoU
MWQFCDDCARILGARRVASGTTVRLGPRDDLGVAHLVPVDDPDDPRLRLYRALNDAELRRAVEDDEGVFVVEGVLVLRRALTSPYPVRSLVLSPNRLEQLGPELDGVDAEVFVASRDVVRAVVGFDLHRGAVGLFGRTPLPPLATVLSGARTVVVLEGVNDHENLGALFRTASALGADAVVLDPTCADPLYRRAVRVSMGEVLHLPFTRARAWPHDLEVLAADGMTVLALTPAGDAMPIDAVDAPERLALLLGAEGPGLTTAALAAAHLRVRIPIRGTVDSLNVGHAAAIALHRLARAGQ